MSSVQVKICGLQLGDDLSFVSQAAVTHIGIVLVRASRRYVAPGLARGITESLPAHVKSVAVFSDSTKEDVVQQAREADVDIVQVHGDESPEDCAWLVDRGLTVWKAVSVPTDTAVAEDTWARIAQYHDVVQGILLDAKAPQHTTITGGHGHAFDWTVLASLAPRMTSLNWWVAGGITPENVETLLSHVQPTGVDVSSGVETQKRKDTRRIEKLLRVVDGR